MTPATVVGHDAQRERLHRAVAQHRLAHALFFAGPDGIGKRTLAVELAGWMLCDQGGAAACGNCAACRQIAAGSHPDVQVIGVAAGRKEIGIDRIRDLKRFMSLQPAAGGAKVAIIDDAHLLTVAAQNALLKTLEEPPHGALLVLVASAPDSLLPTVRSRCQRIQFHPLSASTVEQLLIDRHGIEPTTAAALAAVADGSPGRALTLCRSLVSSEWQQLRQALATLGRARYVHLARMAQELATPEGEVGVKLETLFRAYRDAALRAAGVAQPSVPAPPSSESLSVILRRADAVHDAWRTLRRGNPNRQLLLEALLLRLART
jgi:DNA polymerase-3 subunit delta'